MSGIDPILFQLETRILNHKDPLWSADWMTTLRRWCNYSQQIKSGSISIGLKKFAFGLRNIEIGRIISKSILSTLLMSLESDREHRWLMKVRS